MFKWANQIINKTGFKNPKKIYQASSGNPHNLRNIIYQGTYRDIPAVLKICDHLENYGIREGESLFFFNQNNRSKKLIAPELYKHKQLSFWREWFIMEKLPADGRFLSEPEISKNLTQEERREFLEVYLEYKKYFPRKPWRPLLLAEKLPAHEFHLTRIRRWFEMASDKEIESELGGKKSFLSAELFLPLYLTALALIRKEFKIRPKSWSHGHFKPKDIFYSPQKNVYYLTDFAHNYLYPEGYELAFMVWSDWLMGTDWRMSYPEWRKGINSWIKDLLPVAEKLKIKNPRQLLRVSLIERTLGAILADVIASGRPSKEKRARLNLLIHFLKDLIKNK